MPKPRFKPRSVRVQSPLSEPLQERRASELSYEPDAEWACPVNSRLRETKTEAQGEEVTRSQVPGLSHILCYLQRWEPRLHRGCPLFPAGTFDGCSRLHPHLPAKPLRVTPKALTHELRGGQPREESCPTAQVLYKPGAQEAAALTSLSVASLQTHSVYFICEKAVNGRAHYLRPSIRAVRVLCPAGTPGALAGLCIARYTPRSECGILLGLRWARLDSGKDLLGSVV